MSTYPAATLALAPPTQHRHRQRKDYGLLAISFAP